MRCCSRSARRAAATSPADLATLTGMLSTRGATEAEARRARDAEVRRIIAAARRAGVAASDVTIGDAEAFDSYTMADASMEAAGGGSRGGHERDFLQRRLSAADDGGHAEQPGRGSPSRSRPRRRADPGAGRGQRRHFPFQPRPIPPATRARHVARRGPRRSQPPGPMPKPMRPRSACGWCGSFA